MTAQVNFSQALKQRALAAVYLAEDLAPGLAFHGVFCFAKSVQHFAKIDIAVNITGILGIYSQSACGDSWKSPYQSPNLLIRLPCAFLVDGCVPANLGTPFNELRYRTESPFEPNCECRGRVYGGPVVTDLSEREVN